MADLTLDLIQEISGFGDTFDRVREQVQNFSGDGTLVIPINSFGGDVFEGISIYNLLVSKKYKKRSEVLAYAMSIGTIIALAADKVVMPENGFFMIHNPFAFTMGDSDELQGTAKILEDMTNLMAKIYSEKSGLTVNRVKKLMKTETWFTAKEAKTAGFVDEVVKPVNIAASINPEEFKRFENVPNEIKALFKNQKPTTPTPQPDSTKNDTEMELATILKAEVKRIFGFEGEDVADKLKDEKPLAEVKKVLKAELTPIIKAELTQELTKSIKEGLEDEIKAAATPIIEAAAKDLKAQVTQLKADLDKSITDFNAYKVQAAKDLDEVKAENTKLTKRVEELEVENTKLTKEKESLETTVAELKNKKPVGDNNGGGAAQGRASQNAFNRKITKVSNKTQY